MSPSTKELLADALMLPESERIELASELLASVEGPPDPDWDGAWLAELIRRARRSEQLGDAGTDWAAVRARILARLASG